MSDNDRAPAEDWEVGDGLPYWVRAHAEAEARHAALREAAQDAVNTITLLMATYRPDGDSVDPVTLMRVREVRDDLRALLAKVDR